MICKKLKIKGVVQGVGFRYSTLTKAHELKITGWVKNCSDGTVETLICGSPHQIEQMISWAHKGPSHAEVSHVEIEEATGHFSDFKII